jgi:transcriptional regulator with XRE-family HTH domain
MTNAIDPENKRVGATIKALRRAGGIQQGELAIAAGVSRPYLANIEAGRKYAPVPLCRQIARLLRVSPAAITIADCAETGEASAEDGEADPEDEPLQRAG